MSNFFKGIANLFGRRRGPVTRTYHLTEEAKSKVPKDVIAADPDELMAYMAARTFASGKMMTGSIGPDGGIVVHTEGEEKPEILGYVTED